MSLIMEDALDTGWVAVRPHAFGDRGRHKFVFIVAWNKVEGKFAVTCHDRTMQRRSVARETASCAEEPESCSWAGLFSFQDLRTVHSQLCSVHSDLEPCLPALPEEPSGTWTVLFGLPDAPAAEMDTLCLQLQLYLSQALDACGWTILSQVLFTESNQPEDYSQSLSLLGLKGHEDAVHRARRHLYELLEKHKAMESMVELLEIYQEEDEAYGALVEATTQLYQYLLQPFRDMRELAMLRRQQIKISLENDYLGPRRIESLKKEDMDWQSKAHEAVLSIQDFTVRYFEITAKALKAVYERMRVDQRKLGKAAWAAAVERMERLQGDVSKETLQLMRAREICLEQKKQTLREEMQTLQGGEEAVAHLDHLEAQYYTLQLQLYEIQFEILKCEELLLNTQRESLQRQVADLQDEVVYYDTYESTEAMQSQDELQTHREETTRLQQKVRQLEARRGRITAKKAYLRNKKEICVANHKLKMQQRQEVSHNAMQCIQQAEELQEAEEETRRARMSQERQKTLERLRSFRLRYPGQVVLKSSRQCVTAVQPKPSSSTAPSPEAPRSQTAAVQTEPAPPAGGTVCVPPPPPPPPPPPEKPESKRLLRPSSREAHATPTGVFHSSQLMEARRKLRKTTRPETPHWRSASSPMDEVLASLKRGSFRLRRVEQRGPTPPHPAEEDDDSILAQIRRGVKLRRVCREEEPQHVDLLSRSIHEAMQRIREASPEDEGPTDADWES